MIDPDYNPRRLASLIPYASPLPTCSHLQPRLPGKPVQTMPPSPHRQGRRGNQCPRCSQPLLLEERVQQAGEIRPANASHPWFAPTGRFSTACWGAIPEIPRK